MTQKNYVSLADLGKKTKRKPGQPRKPPGGKRVTIWASVSPKTKLKLDRLQIITGMSLGKALDAVVEHLEPK